MRRPCSHAPRGNEINSAALAHSTVEAMLRFAAGRPMAGAVSAAAISWAVRALRTMQRNHHVEGTVLDTRGRPIRGVQVRAVQFNHEADGLATDYRDGDNPPSLASAVTDLAGRYRLSLPQDTIVTFAAYHAWFVGPMFHCRPDDQTIRPVALEDAGGIAGTVVDAATGWPVAGARIGSQRIEHTDRVLGGNWGSAISDAQGHFPQRSIPFHSNPVVAKRKPRGPARGKICHFCNVVSAQRARRVRK